MSQQNQPQLLSTQRLKETLKQYESDFPEDTVRCLSYALTGQEDGIKYQFDGEDPIPATLENTIRAINLEIAKEDSEQPIPFEKLQNWKRLCNTLAAITKDTDPIEYQLRQYNTDEHTPAEINEHGKQGPFGMLLHSRLVTGTGTLIAYPLRNGEYAILLNRENQTGETFQVKYPNRYYGSFEVAFADDVEAYIISELQPNDWYRPENIPTTNTTTLTQGETA